MSINNSRKKRKPAASLETNTSVSDIEDTDVSVNTPQPSTKDTNEIVNEGIVMFEKINGRLGSQIEKTDALIKEIHQLCAERGVVIPALNNAIVDSNRLMVFKSKLDQYLHEIKDDRNSIEKKISIISVMVELAETINNVGHTEVE